MRGLFLSLVALAFAVSCSQKNSNVSLELTSSFVFGTGTVSTSADGGLMVWGRSDNGNSFGRVVSDSNTLQLDLPNGTWTFMAVAWKNGSSVPLNATQMRCAVSPATQLAGSAVSAQLQLTQANCNGTLFKGDLAAIAATNSITFSACRELTNITGATDECSNNWAGASWKSYRAPVQSMRVRMMSYNSTGSTFIEQGDSLTSSCIAMSATGEAITSNIQLPLGNGVTAAFATEVEFHLDSSTCADPAPIKRLYKQGLANTTSNSKYFLNGSAVHKVFVSLNDTEICDGRKSNTPFANSAPGSESFPYLICTPAQMQNMMVNANCSGSNCLNKSFRLLADIDLNYSRRANLPSSAYANLPSYAQDCWDLGQNWMPLGMYHTSNSSCPVSTNSYVGSIYGGGHKIKNLNVKSEDNSSVGLIGDWAPLSTTATIRDLIIENAEIKGKYAVGTLFGVKSTATATVVENIELKKGNIESEDDGGGNSWVGGLFGKADSITVNKVRVSDTVVRGKQSYVGGVFGKIVNGDGLQKIAVTAHVMAENGSYHGGIGGYTGLLATAQDTTELVHHGMVSSRGSYIGGLFGSLFQSNTARKFSNSYATSAINSRSNSNVVVGGLIGHSDFSGNFMALHFSGHMLDACTTTCDRGNIFGTYTTSPVTSSVIYYLTSALTQIVTGNGDIGITTTTQANTGLSALFQATTITGFISAPWIHKEGDLPRLVWEQHPCALENQISVANQLVSGRGTSANPVLICHKTQFADLGLLTSGKYAKLLGTINLSGSFSEPTIHSGVTVDGGQALVMGYYVNNSPAGYNEVKAPIAQNSGTMKNFNFANIYVRYMMSGYTGSHVSAVTGINSGTIDGLNVFSSSVSNSEATASAGSSGVASLNTGVIKNFEVDMEIDGIYNVSGVVKKNIGKITDGTVRGQLNSSGTSPYNFAGIAVTNGDDSTVSLIKRVTVRNNMSLSSSTLYNSAMLVSLNKINATIQDVKVHDDAYWSAQNFGTGNAHLVSNNTGTVIRAVAGGSFYSTDNSNTSFTDSDVGKLVKTNSGTVAGVYSTVPFGRLLYQGSASCTSSMISSFNLTLGGYGSAFWNGTLQVIWVAFEDASGNLVVKRATGHTESAGTAYLTMPASTCSGTLSNAFFFHAPYDAVGTIAAGGLVDISLLTKANLNTNAAWSGQVLNETDDFNTVINFYLNTILGLNPTPPAPWAIGFGDGLEILEVK